jgi:hypothetical protein
MGREAPDYAQPLEAWRVWRVVERNGELSLASVVKRTTWPPRRPFVGECLRCRRFRDWARRRPRHEAPDGRCQCGVYATDLARAGAYLLDTLPAARARLLGRVALWGTVVECEHGYRAARAYPLTLYVPVDASPDRSVPADTLAPRLARYGVPVVLLPAGRSELPALLETVG